MNHSGHTRLAPEELMDTVLVNAPIYDDGGNEVGRISHVHRVGANTDLVIDVGGFLGIGSKPVLLSASQVDLMRDGNGKVHGRVRWTKEELKELPEHYQ